MKHLTQSGWPTQCFCLQVNYAAPPQLIKAATSVWKTISQNTFPTFFSVLFSNWKHKDLTSVKQQTV